MTSNEREALFKRAYDISRGENWTEVLPYPRADHLTGAGFSLGYHVMEDYKELRDELQRRAQKEILPRIAELMPSKCRMTKFFAAYAEAVLKSQDIRGELLQWLANWSKHLDSGELPDSDTWIYNSDLSTRLDKLCDRIARYESAMHMHYTEGTDITMALLSLDMDEE